jgi:hypothetical protein
MILTEAKKRARSEFEDQLSKTGLTLDAARARLDRNPAMKKATWRVPHRGIVGTAANLVRELSQSGRA